ncbi:MAG: PilZ domain-containing protein [Bdellovibrionales bacterium]|nr:PilZ domain-containing protein [Bdellovibrionales bacterium]
MSTDGKVLTFPKQRDEDTEKKSDSKKLASIVDIGARRQEIIQDERRSVKRTILTEFIGVHTVVPGYGLQKCALYDISENGIAFDLTEKQGRFHSGEQVAMRVYLNHKTYFTFTVQIKTARLVREEGVCRHGASLVKGSVNEEALKHFIMFIESVSASLKTDHGDVIVSNLDNKN